MNRSRGPWPILLFLAASCLAGCDPGPRSTTATGPAAPHDGLIVELPDGGGFVEVVQKKPSSSKGPLDKELSFYFLKDMTTPLAPSPSSGTLTIGKKSVELRADGEALVTPPGPPLFYQGDLGGILKVDISGTSKDIPLRVR